MKLNLANLPKVGETFEVKVKSATFTVEVLDARIRYGNVDALVKPVEGSGTFWTVYRGIKSESKPLVLTTDSVEEVEDDVIVEEEASLI